MTSYDDTIRRVITGESGGTSVFAIDDRVSSVVNGTTGVAYWRLWGSDQPPVVPVANAAHATWLRTIFTANPGGFRVHIIEWPAAGTTQAARGNWPEYGLGPYGRYDDAESGMHWTSTVDVMFILSGSIGLEQSDGQVVVLRQGDVLVQNGALHAWRLQSEPCRAGVVALGAARVDTSP